MALYLKYRPKDFESLVWQDFINKTLKQAINSNKTVGAYLLCWPRWTWKTSTARILAKAVNCKDLKNWNPCNKCDICESINNENLVDVIEIDAASNTWVDNIREIISKANFRPTNSKFKIYIIDEVHMLSKWAFNALLKILEEPPEFVKFILATTETHKVPETIISRCQRYDFKNLNKKDLKDRLTFIAKSEKIKIDDESLDYIVKVSNGWARNAISLFEQLIVENEIKYETIETNLWISSHESIEDFLNKLIKKDSSIIKKFEDLGESWKNIKLFFKDLILFTKNQAIEKLKQKKQITRYIEVLEELDLSYSKTKNSLDENTTFLISILKMIDNNNISIEKNTKQKSTKQQIKETKNEKEPKTQNENKIKINDLWDIFWEDSTKNEVKEIKSNKSFDKKLFLEKLKQNGVKWLITSSLKQSEINLDDKKLNIKFQNQFVYNQFNSIDNIKIIKDTLESMWIKNLEVNLN